MMSQFWFAISAVALMIPVVSVVVIRRRAARKERALGKRRKPKIYL